MDQINVVLTIDKRFIQHAGVMLKSIFKNSLGISFTINCVYDGPRVELKTLKRFVENSGQKFESYFIEKEKVKDYKISQHVSGATYYRLFLPDLLQHINRGIYLDADLLVMGSLRELWNTSLEGNIIGAVAHENHESFNGGVLLIDFEAWRENNISEKMVEWLKENGDKVIFWDQDALNAQFKDSTLQLDDKWNQSTLEENTKILHFMGMHKPWDFHCTHPDKHLYFDYLKTTPWKNFRMVEEKLMYKIKQQIKIAMNKIGFFNYEENC